MADLDIAIAGRSYRVACADGEEDNLTRAAALLADEAEILREQFGGRFASLPESRVLLMASLMLGDRFRATLDAAAEAPEPEAAPAPGTPGASQPGFFDDTLAARVAELEAELAEARDSEAAAVAALEDAALRVRTLAAEIQEDVGLDDDEAEDDDGDDDEDEDGDDDDRAEDAGADEDEDEPHGEGDDLSEEDEDDDLDVRLSLDGDEPDDEEDDADSHDPDADPDAPRR